MVVIRPVSIPIPSLRSTCTTGARQLVVQDAFEMISCFAASYSLSLTPITMVFTSPLPGAEMITFLAPAAKWPFAFSESVNKPVDSITYSTPSSFQGSCEGSFVAAIHFVLKPLTTKTSSTSTAAPLFSVERFAFNLPWTESYLSW